MSENQKWKNQQKSVKATQIAFELEQEIASNIQQLAVKQGLTASNFIRKNLGLSYSIPKRPRLTVSLNKDDYAFLGEKYAIDKKNNLEIKRKIIEELINLFKN